jgi:hypothetical protein
VLLAIIIGGSLFGIFGMLIAVPVAASVQVFARHWLVAYRSSEVYRGDRDQGGAAAAVTTILAPAADPRPTEAPAVGVAARAAAAPAVVPTVAPASSAAAALGAAPGGEPEPR